MSSDTCLALLLDGPMQSWGHTSRFDRRTTALHPTRSGVVGLIAAAMGINKHAPTEVEHLKRFEPLRMSTISLGRLDERGRPIPMRRLEDYHTVTGIRRASGKVETDATVQTYRHYLLDARFVAILEGPVTLLGEIAAALEDPRWGVWFGRKSCIPASPVLATGPGPRSEVWAGLLKRLGMPPTWRESSFDQILEVAPTDPEADRIDDAPIAFGASIGNRHAPRWIKTQSRTGDSLGPE